jgi:hypothetical protein
MFFNSVESVESVYTLFRGAKKRVFSEKNILQIQSKIIFIYKQIIFLLIYKINIIKIITFYSIIIYYMEKIRTYREYR